MSSDDAVEGGGRSHRPTGAKTSIANRDQPLFTSRRHVPASQNLPEFFTESLNTTYIPSPSPTRSGGLPGTGARPRQALHSSKVLAAALKASQDKAKERGDKSPRPDSAPRRPLQTTRRTQSALVDSPGSPSPSGRRSRQSRGGTRTPSPPRGRAHEVLLSPASNASASSPPRGLAEAYRRIEDEEDLAGLEDDSDLTGDDRKQAWDNEADNRRLDIRKRSGSPGSRRHSRRYSPIPPRAESPEQEVQTRAQTETTQSSISSSPLREFGEDEEGRGMSQRARDEQRVREALGNNARPFRNDRPKRRSLTVENLQRTDIGSGSSSFGSASVSSRGSDPPYNLPREWGRKERKGTGWLSRLGRDGEKPIEQADDPKPMPEDVATRETKTSSSSIVDWVAAASKVPPSVPEDKTPLTSSSRNPGSTSQLRPPSSIDRIRRWEVNDDDFAGQSLHTSNSPPIRIRTTAIDAIRDREIQSLAKSAVTTNRLGALREKESIENLRPRAPSSSTSAFLDDGRVESSSVSDRRRSSAKSSLKSSIEAEEAPATDGAELAQPGEQIDHAGPFLEDMNGTPIPNSPIVVFNAGSRASSRLGLFGGKESGLSVHSRVDSRDLLRQLARATSASPSPSLSDKEKESKLKRTSLSNEDRRSLREGSRPQGTRREQDPVPEATREKAGTESKPPTDRSTPDEKEHITQMQEPDRLFSDVPADPATISNTQPPVERAPLQPKSKALLATPQVAGAWIETPHPTRRDGRPIPKLEDVASQTDLVDAALIKLAAESLATQYTRATSLEKARHPPLEDTAPSLPGSALAAIIEKAKRNKVRSDLDEAQDDTLLLDDSTIQSLEELLANGSPVAGLPSTRASSGTPKPPIHSDPLAKPLTATATQEQENRSYRHLASRLSMLGVSLRDAKNGIASLERAVSAAPPSMLADPASQDECTEGGEFHDFIFPCAKCGCPGGRTDATGDWQMLQIPLPRLWRWRQADWRPRLTWLGALTLLLGAWWAAEQFACLFYCPPFYAERMAGYGVDYDAPRPPLLVPKLLWRAALGPLLAPLWTATCVLVRLGASLGGFGPGVFGHGDEGQPAGGGGGGGRHWVFRELPPWEEAGWSGAEVGVGADGLV